MQELPIVCTDEGAWRRCDESRPSMILTLDELAAYLKVGKRTLYGLAAKGKIPAFKVDGVWRFRRGEIDQWIADQTQASTKKKKVIRKCEKQKSADRDLSQLRDVRRSRRTK